jgi:hypothetical protein
MHRETQEGEQARFSIFWAARVNASAPMTSEHQVGKRVVIRENHNKG